MKCILAVLVLSVSTLAFADNTPYKEIDRVQFNAESGSYFAYSASGWNVCDGTQYVQLHGNTANREIFISQVLAAHIAQKAVRFSGTCTNSNGYLDATYIIIDK